MPRRGTADRGSRPVCFLPGGAVPLALLTLLLALLSAGCLRGPRVASISPADGAGGVNVDVRLTVTFDQPVREESLADAVRLEPASGAIEVSLSQDGKTATLTARDLLRPVTTYTLTVAREARGVDGARLRRAAKATFTTAQPRAATCHRPAWSPDGAQLAWLEEGDDGWSLWVAALAGGAPRRLPVRPWPDTRAVWAPGGDRLLVVLASEAPGKPMFAEFCYVDPHGADPARPLAFNERLEETGFLSAVFSPDGSMLAVENDKYAADAHSDLERQLGMAAADGTGFRDFGNLLVGWGPDSSTLIYLDMPGIGEGHHFEYDIFRYDVRTGQKTLLAAAGKIANFGRACRAPDGSHFVFWDWRAEEVQTPDGPTIQHVPRDLWRLSADGLAVARITDGAGHCADPSLAPGSALVFGSDRGGDWDVWFLGTAAPATAVNLTARRGYDGQPEFAPDGDLVAFVSDASGAPEVWVMRRDGSERFMISGFTRP